MSAVLPPSRPAPGTRNWYTRASVACDLDGTLCVNAYPDFGAPVAARVDLLRRRRARGWWIVVTTSRPHAQYPEIMAWLAAHDVPCDQLICAAKPNVDLFLDDRAALPPAPVLDVLAEWRALTADPHALADAPLTALATGRLQAVWALEQMAVPENPSPPTGLAAHLRRTRDTFRVCIPFSGGMDSTTAWAMAVDAGLPVHLTYVHLGQPYAAAEIAAARNVLGPDGPSLQVIVPPPTPAKQWQHITLGRNARILWLLATQMQQLGWWGEIWFGNLAGESPAVGGDKSSRFLVTLQGLFTALGLDVRLVNPLIGLDKPDEVRWWRDRGRLAQFAQTKSCFAVDAQQCGHCQTCFRRYVAYQTAGVAVDALFPAGCDWTPFVHKYRPLMRDAVARADWSRYSPARCRDTLAVIDALAAADPTRYGELHEDAGTT